MKKPEWLVKLEKAIAGVTETIKAHTDTANIHRAIHVSTEAPTAEDGNDGDIWVQYEE